MQFFFKECKLLFLLLIMQFYLIIVCLKSLKHTFDAKYRTLFLALVRWWLTWKYISVVQACSSQAFVPTTEASSWYYLFLLGKYQFHTISINAHTSAILDTSKALVPYHVWCSCLWPNIDRLRQISSPNRTSFRTLFGNSCVERR